MNSSLILENLLTYMLQSGALLLTALLIPHLLRLRDPRWRLRYLYAVLLAVLLLPVVQPWRRPVATVSRVAPDRIQLPQAMLTRADQSAGAPIDWPAAGLALLVAGAGLRGVWLAIGLIQLRRYRRSAQTLFAVDGVPVALSDEVPGPVTFGVRRPVILIPPRVLELQPAERDAVLAHERIHVRRRDWVFALCEELVSCALWFHPGIWLLMDRIRLTRERVVDAEVLRASTPGCYAAALLAVAGGPSCSYLAPAPSFARRRHLLIRIQNLFLESPMPLTRLAGSYIAAALLTLGVVSLSVSVRPLTAAPQLVAAPPSNTFDIQGAELVHGRLPATPPLARQKGIEGTVTLEVHITATGEVSDARVIAGPEELKNAALAAVLGWQFKPAAAIARVNIMFRKPQEPAGESAKGSWSAIEIAEDVPPAIAATLRTRLQPFIGQPYSPIHISGMDEILRDLSPALRSAVVHKSENGEVSITYRVFTGSPFQFTPKPGSPQQVRVGGAVQAGNLIEKVDPVYPALARQARIQGTVRFDAVIDASGSVAHVQVASGHPLLVPAALDAVRQYRYRPLVVNEKAVEVLTQVDVNFTLNQ